MTEQFNDRAWLLEQQQAQQAEMQAISVAEQYAAQGVGLATFCQSFFDVLTDDERRRFTRTEIVTMLLAAIQAK